MCKTLQLKAKCCSSATALLYNAVLNVKAFVDNLQGKYARDSNRMYNNKCYIITVSNVYARIHETVVIAISSSFES